MRVLLYTPWGNRWKDSTSRAFAKAGIDSEWTDGRSIGVNQLPDVILSMWCNEFTIEFQRKFPDIPLYTYIRHYEAFTTLPEQINWSKIKGLFFCAKHVQHIANMKWPYLQDVPQYVIPNWVDQDEWPLKKDLTKNKKIAMVGRLNGVKNFAMALQIIAQLPTDYTLDIAGSVQDESLIWYMQNFLEQTELLDRVTFHGHVDDVQGFLQDKTFILSTSYREGCPMNVLEGMSMGLKPIVHSWLGAMDIFPRHVFVTEAGAENLILLDDLKPPSHYRAFVIKNHGLDLADKLVEIVKNG